MEKELIQRMLECARRIDRRNLQTNNGGNFSCRAPQGDLMLVKGTDVSFSTVTEDSIVYADFNGQRVSRQGPKPSKESLLHGLLYANFPEINAIMHFHSPWATAWSNCETVLENPTYHAPLKLGSVVPVFHTGSYAVPLEHAQRIIAELKENYPDAKAFLLRGHGIMAFDSSIEAATNIAELVEETAQIATIERLHRAALSALR